MFYRHPGLVAICAYFALSLGWAHGQNPVSADVVARAWQARQARLQSVRAEWIDRKTIPKGRFNDLNNSDTPLQGATSEGRAPSDIPPEDITLDLPAALFLDGTKVKYTRDHPVWSETEHKFVLSPQQSVFDGSAGKQMKSSPNSRNQGIVKSRNPIGHQISLAALIMTFRPMDPDMRLFDIESFTSTGRRSVIDGRPCVQLQSQNGERIRDIWLDLGRDFALVRYIRTLRGRTQVRLDVRYRQETNGEWVPESWDAASFFLGNQLSQSIRGSACKVRFDVPIEAGQYQLDFTEGTTYVDERVAPGDKPKFYKVQSGRPEIIPRSGPSGSRSGIVWNPWLWLILGVVTAALLCGRLMLARRSAATPP